MKTLSLIGLMITLTATAYGADKNICDDLIANGAPASAINACWEKHGKSEYYLERQQEILEEADEREEAERRAEQQRAAEEARLQRLQQAISKKTFTFIDLRNEGFGLPYIAKQTTYKYDGSGYVTGKEDEMITTGTEMCKYLGFEKAERVIINKKGVSAREAKGKALHIETKNPLFGSKKYEQKVYTSDKRGRKVYYFNSITCVRSRIADNELMEHISEIVSYLEADLQTGAPVNRDNTRVHDGNRNANDSSNDDDDVDADMSDFIYSRGTGQ